MAEYLIRTGAGEWPAFHRDRMESVLIPSEGFQCEPVEGWGDFRMSCGDTTVAFSGEMHGWQVVIEGAMSDGDGDRLVEIITRQVAAEIGEPCEWVRYD